MQSLPSVSPRCEVQHLHSYARRGFVPARVPNRQRSQQIQHSLCAAHPHTNSAFAALAALAPPQAGAKSRRRAPAVQQKGADDDIHLYDVLGLGQAMVDYSASVEDAVLAQCNVPKGARRVVTVEERAQVLESLDEYGCTSQLSTGGSLANTLVAVARLARQSSKHLRIALAGSMGVDALGCYFNAQMEQSGVDVLLDEQAAHTGTVMVLTTPDAQRSFLSFFTSGDMQLTDAVKHAIRNSRVLVIEGYLWEVPNALEYIRSAAVLARESGAQVILTAGDPGVVQRHRDEIMAVIEDGVDMIFTNMEEASGIVGTEQSPGKPMSADEAARRLGSMCSMAVVTDGARGAYITALGELHTIPPHWAAIGPVDTCGAGDAFAAGVLYAVLAGHDLRTAGRFASRVASAVIGRFGPHLSVDDADELVAELPAATADGGVARRALRRQGLASINGSMSGSMDEMDYQWSV